MMPKTVLWAWAALAAALYAALAYGSYVTLPSYADGMLGFDMRPFGMSGGQAVAYLEALTEAGVDYYLNWLRPLDTVFIVALTSLLLAVSWRVKGRFGIIAALAALAYAGCDLIENRLAASLIAFGTKGSTAAMAETIAAFTTGKFLSLGLAVAAIFTAWRRKTRHAQG